MRKLVAAVFSVLAFAAIVALPANANPTRPATASTSRLSLTAKITSFRATDRGVVARGTLTGTLNTGTHVSHQSAPVSFAVAAARRGARCNVITLRLAPLNLELLGVQVTTSDISLDVYALHGRVLGNLFCALANAKVTLPHAARAASALNAHLHGRPLQVFAASQSLPASAA